MECLHVYLGKILYSTSVYKRCFQIECKTSSRPASVIGIREHKTEEIFEEISPTVKRFWLQTILRKMNILEIV